VQMKILRGILGLLILNVRSVERSRIRAGRYAANAGTKKRKTVWNGTDALYSTSRDEWFFDEQDLIDHCYDNRETCDDLKLVIGVPVYAAEIDPYDHYADDLPEDMDLPDDLEQAFKELNETIRFCKIPLSWSHGRFAAIITQKEKTNGIN